VQITAAADELRHQLLAGIPSSELRTCIKVLMRIYEKAERHDASVRLRHNGQRRDGHPITKKKVLRGATAKSK
jgi:hypothetical protein